MVSKTVCCCSFILLIGLLTDVQAQDITLNGTISDRQTGQKLEMANITLQEVAGDDLKGTTTDANGLYQFSGLQTGEYLFKVQYLGYKTYTDTLTLEQSGQTIQNNIRLERSSESLEEVTITEAAEDVEAGKKTIEVVEIGRVPTPAGSADLASYLITQPGVVSTGDRGGNLFIRGGTPSENLVLMDGSLVYQPFHILGFFSVFPEDVISEVNLYAGGFGAEYRSRTSSVMDVQLKYGNLYNTNWSASVSPFISDLFLETPIKEGESSVMVSLRGSLIEGASGMYLQEQQPLRFNSQLVKYSNVSEQMLCSTHFLRTYDRGKLDFEGGDFFKWSNYVVGGHCGGVSEESFVDMNFGISYFDNEAGGDPSRLRTSNAFKFNFEVNLAKYLDDWRIEYGFFTNYRSLKYNIANQFLSFQESDEALLSTGFFASLSIPFWDNPGVSYTNYLEKLDSSIEPRLQLSWQPRGKVDEEIHAAVGIYKQPLIGLSDYRDAGSAFTAWIPMPDTQRTQEAKHALLGWRQPIGRFLDFSVEGYYKDMRSIPISVWSPVAKFQANFEYAEGDVHGVDIRLDFDHRHFYAGLGYGYSYTIYETEQEHFDTWFGESTLRYHPPHDRRHQFNAQAGLEIGNFKANLSWMYGSGLPYTRPLGFDSFFSFEERPPDVRGEYGNPRVLVEKPFEGRLPDFHRLDVSLEQIFEFQKIQMTVQAGAVNAYNWQNIFFYDVFTQRGINQLPFMPYISLELGSI